MKLRFIILFVLSVVLIVSVILWFNKEIEPASRTVQPAKEFVIPKGESLRSITNRLEQEGLIRSSVAFFILTRFGGTAEKIQAGIFHLSQSMDARTIASTLTRGSTDVWVTTLEGWRAEEVAQELAKTFSIPEKEFLRLSYEGYLFPDTYLIPREASTASIIKQLTSNFDKRVDKTLRDGFTRQGLTLNQAITLASIVEREGRTDEDRPVIAGILLKRLKADWPLQADATLQYALGYQSKDKTWWKKEITEEDKAVDSAFNTYKNTHLPPTPIANPGLAAIKAVAHPKETDYWYYLHDTKGEVHYAKTLEEHQKNIQKYLQ